MTPPYIVIAVPIPARKEFTYRLPENLPQTDLVGRRAVVPFGTRKLTGVVVGTTDEPPPAKAKDVIEFLDEAPLVEPALLRLTRWIADYYIASWGETLRSALPVGWSRRSRRYLFPLREGETPGGDGIDRALDRMVREAGRLPVSTVVRRLGHSSRVEGSIRRLVRAGRLEVRTVIEDTPGKGRQEVWVEVLPEGCANGVEKTLRKNAVRQIECLLYLREKRRARRGELAARFGGAPLALEKRGLVRSVREERVRIADGGLEDTSSPDLPLTEEQERALRPLVEAVRGGRFETHLVYGITGSGKTEIYLRAASVARSLGRSVLVLVPEIGLTPQAVGRFRSRFGKETVVLHSALTRAERHDTWREIHRGRFPVVVGVRSAVFAPLKNLGLIVVDEEHDGSYKQGESPRYHARDVAVMRGKLEKVPVVLGSATPSVESYGNAISGKYRLATLWSRIEDRPLPRVDLVDLRAVPYKERAGVISPLLVERIGETLKVGNQAMVFLNRRGFSPFLHCPDCGFVPRCSHCDVTYTYHKRESILRCHYCGTELAPPARCLSCGGSRTTHRGIGTQRVEEDLARAFPSARIARMDLDTTRRRDAAREILTLFSGGQIDILIGTQMIAKGHHFPRVSLVGVINADTALNLPDFRAGERSFQLLLQVAGRAGRGEREGEVVIQTFGPNHYCVRAAARHDYEGFIERELADRKELRYPPFSRIVSLTFRGKQEDRVQRAARRFRELLLTDRMASEFLWEVLGPTPAPIPKIRDRFRWKLLLKGRVSRWGGLRGRLSQLLDHFRAMPAGKQAEVIVDVDAYDLL